MTGFLKINDTAEARIIDTDKALKINRRIAMISSLGLLAVTAGLISCQTKLSRSTVIDTPIVCQVFEPIEVIESDSKRTKEQVDVYNATWDHYCKRD